MAKPRTAPAVGRDRALFQVACEALWGPMYVSEAGRQLGVSLRTAQRWDSGETETIPAWVGDQLRERLERRQEVIDRVLSMMAET